MAHAEFFGVRHDLADHLLALIVGGMGLAGEHELDWADRVQEQTLEALALGQEQVGSLVGGKAAGETNGQGVGVEQLVGPGCFGGRGTRVDGPLMHPVAHEGHEPRTGLVFHPPQLVVGGGPDAVPTFGLRLVPIGEHMAREQVGHVGRYPGGGVDTVGDRCDRYLIDREFWPEVREHLAADYAVQLGDGI